MAAFQLIQSGWGQPGLPGWDSVVDNTEVNGPIGLEELVFQVHLLEVREVGGFGTYCADMRSEGKGLDDGNFRQRR